MNHLSLLRIRNRTIYVKRINERDGGLGLLSSPPGYMLDMELYVRDNIYTHRINV